jgi:hypothetical protein
MRHTDRSLRLPARQASDGTYVWTLPPRSLPASAGRADRVSRRIRSSDAELCRSSTERAAFASRSVVRPASSRFASLRPAREYRTPSRAHSSASRSCSIIAPSTCRTGRHAQREESFTALPSGSPDVLALYAAIAVERPHRCSNASLENYPPSAGGI